MLVLIILTSSYHVEARPNLTPEELAKAREVAAQMDPPIDFEEGRQIRTPC